MTTAKLLNTIIQPFYYHRVYRLYKADLSNVPTPRNAPPPLELRRLDKTDSHLLEQITRMEEWLDAQLEETLNSGSLCLAALDGETLAGFNLISFRRIYLPSVRYKRALPPGTAFSEQISVNKAYRAQGLATTLRLEVFRTLNQEGIRYLYGGTDIRNAANLALCRKVGLNDIADIHYRKRFSQEQTIVRRAGAL